MSTPLLGVGRGNGAAAGVDLLTGLVAYYKMEESSGNRLDSSGNGRTLTLTGTLGSRSGLIGNALDKAFDNSNYLVSANAAFRISGSFTVAFWFNPDTLEATLQRTILARWNALSNNNLSFWIGTFGANPNQRFAFYASASPGTDTGSGAEATTFGKPTTGSWHWVCCEHENGVALRISVNNGTPNVLSFTGGVNAGTRSLYVGIEESTIFDPCDGALDSLGIWDNRIFNAAEKAALYAAGAGFDPV